MMARGDAGLMRTPKGRKAPLVPGSQLVWAINTKLQRRVAYSESLFNYRAAFHGLDGFGIRLCI